MLRFRAPGSPLSAAKLVARALGVSEPRAAERVRAGALASDRETGSEGRIRAPDALVAPGTLLRLEAEPPAEPAETALGDWLALVPAPPWREGRVAGFAFASEEEHAGLARLRLTLEGAQPAAVRAWLAAAGAPVLGDVVHGGILVAGGLRLWSLPADASDALASELVRWPDEPVFPPASPDPGAVLRISPATARALARGHPWVIADRETERGDRYAPGTLVALASASGERHGLARVEGSRELAARVWAPAERRSPNRGAGRPSRAGGASIEERVALALARRAALLEPGAGTDALRLVHGEADGLPALAVDRLGPLLRVLVTGRAALPLRERVVAALLAAKLPGLPPDPPVVEVVHLRERPPGALVCVRLVGGARAALPDPLVVREGALCFAVESGLAEPTRPHPGVGFFLDQRENRARLAARAASGGRYLNLFAHTGGFSAALLAGGADEVQSVDLSGAWLAQLERNLERSGLASARHRTARREARRFLDELDPALRFEGVVLDPPTAASAGRRFWSVRRDLEPLVAAALARLVPGGFLLVTRQDRAGRGRLPALVAAAAAGARVRLASLEPAPPGADFPALPGFPEGAPFEALLATRA